MSDTPISSLEIEVVDGVASVGFLTNSCRNNWHAEEFGRLVDLVENGGVKQLRIDFATIYYITSGELGLLISLKKVVDSGGLLKIINMHPEIREVFRVTRLDQVFEIEGDGEAGALVTS